MSCEHAHLDGAYVLGALSPAERQEFERHLPGCPRCSEAVSQLAGLPGLLARVDVEVLADRDQPPVPETLLPALMREVRRGRRRRVLAGVGLAAAAATVVGAVALGGAPRGDSPPAAGPGPGTSAPAAASRAMTPVGGTALRATLAMQSVPWGTRLSLECSYPAGDVRYGAAPRPTYALLVHTRDGRSEQVATWRAVPGRRIEVVAATAAGREDIASVEVHAASGDAVLKLAG